MSEIDFSNVLIHHGVKGMKWGFRKDRKLKGEPRKRSKPLSRREKVLVGSLVASGVIIAAAGATIATLKIRNTQHKISTAKGFAWVENMLDGVKEYQNVSPERLRSTYPDKNTFNVVEQFLRNRDMLKYMNKT